MTGTITKVVREKGFGFLQALETGKEYFFHRSACGNIPNGGFEIIQYGEIVEFEEGFSPKGPRAENLRRV